MADRMTLPVLPLRDAVLFPGVATPIGAGRPATLRAIEAALKQPDRKVFAVAQKENVDQVSPGVLYTTGTIARISQVQRNLGGVQLVVHGDARGTAVHYTETNGYLEATVRETSDLPPLNEKDAAFVALHREVRERAGELGQKSGLPTEVVQQVLQGVSDPGALADLVAGHLDIQSTERQQLLETLAVEDRLRRVLVHVQRQIAVLDAQEDIKSQVQEELGERQREMLLREQMKAIRKELGEEEEAAEADDLRKRLEALDLPEAARKEVDRELTRLERAGRESMEAQVIRTYLETVAELPWNKRADESLDLKRAAEILEEDHYGLQDVKDQVLEFLAVRQLRQRQPKTEAPGNEDDRAARAPTLLFVGPPGVGKTSIAKSIARAMGRPYVRISLGGARDEADIRGHRRTYVGAMPGRIIQGMKQAGAKNPIFLLDEVDKLGISFQGDPAAALLEVLDPAQNDTFTDHYLGVPFDLSEVLFIATANFLQSIPAPLLDRLETVNFAGYTEREKLEIAKRYLVPRQLRENGLLPDQLTLTDGALSEMIASYTREAGVRQLEREIGKLGRKIARKIADGAAERVTVRPQDVPDLIGRPKVHPERMAGEDQVGVSTGMYYTPAGGDIMFVEASVMRGKGELVLTGQLGDVMKESARAALTYAKSHADLLGIPEGAFVDTDIHVHVPAGAIPKDGPSAGVTMATALVSALSRRPARHDIAMTGEVTLRGRVLPIGGVKEKVLGAVRAGISSVILPKENERDLEDLPDEVRKTLEVHLVEDLDEVLSLALRGARFESGHLIFETEASVGALARAHSGHN
ncbi:MAG: endopeptidase La [Gemmatimonadetes bacterium 13_2_20CM_2_65_7]|nr:MAG: endopeptidase La [Gemmatimonadetes bacterium 13_2_20CM_2_65_7]OLC99804.1 MAG: endopeptidase La [Gemmatimonadetes bacterium 13_1_40CM_3_65_8]